MSPYLEVMRVKKATLKRKGGKKILIHLDGEPVKMEGKLKFRVVPGSLKVMVPLRRRKNLLNQPISLIPSRLQR